MVRLKFYIVNQKDGMKAKEFERGYHFVNEGYVSGLENMQHDCTVL